MGKIIGIDIDNVIADTVPSLLPKINTIFKTHLKYRDVYMYDFHTILGLSDQEMKLRFWQKPFMKSLFLGMSPVNNAKRTLNILYKKHKIFLVTDRPKELVSITREWLKKEQIPFHGIRHMTGGFKSKHNYAEYQKIRGFGFDVFVEDKLEDAILLAKHCKKVLLFKRPWNISENVNRSFLKVTNWSEIIINI